MTRNLLFLCALIITLHPCKSHADEPLRYLSAALILWDSIAPVSEHTLFQKIHFQQVEGHNAPLARYQPNGKGGTIQIGQNFRDYRRDYVYLVSNQDMSNKPDFDQYMTVLTTLSLANESAHYLQDKNGSLHDFQEFYDHGKTTESCALYSLQQYVSDVVMLEKAVRIERYFLGTGSVKGLNALRVALEKNDLRDEFEDFREGLKTRDTILLNTILKKMRNKREDANMAGLKFCASHGDALLDKSIIDRATEPARDALTRITKPMAQKPTKDMPLPGYNQ
jgi:hypothetical protein